MFLSFILKNKDSFFNLEPSQTGHFTSSINPEAQRLIVAEPLSSCWFFIKCEIPSKSILYSLVIPNVFDSTKNLSFPPFKIISMASSEIFSIGSVILKLYFSPIISNCLKIQVDLYSPKGAKPPIFTDSLGFGIIILTLISLTVPKPLQ